MTTLAANQNLAVTRRRFMPFGEVRGNPPAAWPDESDFVGGRRDASMGLVQLGAREYDPALGRFVSVDPIIDPNDPQQLNGYVYADNNPASMSDPDGLKYFVEADGSVYIPSKKHATKQQIKRAASKAAKFARSNEAPADAGRRVQSHRPHPGGVRAGQADPEHEPLRRRQLRQDEGLGQRCHVRHEQGRQKRVELDSQLVQGPDVGLSQLPRRYQSADGRHIPISQVELGDEVSATDPKTRRTTAQRVTALHINLDRDFVDLSVRDGRTTTTLYTTSNHPFWSVRHRVMTAATVVSGIKYLWKRRLPPDLDSGLEMSP